MFFSKEDVPWLVEVFWKKKAKGNRYFDMEVDHGFRLYIHQRDFIAGRTIRANITDGLEKSRRVIFVMSKCVSMSLSFCGPLLLFIFKRHQHAWIFVCFPVTIFFSLLLYFWQKFPKIQMGNGRIHDG